MAEVAKASHHGEDFIEHAQSLFRLAVCSGAGPRPRRIRAKDHARHCRALREATRQYRAKWLRRALPFFRREVPDNLPPVVVYPFGGADLLTALAVFPKLSEVTTISLEPAGDPRAVTRVRRRELERSLAKTRSYIGALLRKNHSRTRDILQVTRRGEIPGHLIFSLVALSIHGFEPVSLRYFRLTPDGSIRYIDADDLAALDRKLSNKRLKRKARARAARELFANMELRFRKKGEAGAPVRTYRHIRGNLDDSHLLEDGRVIRHLEAKGSVTAMTKAASYLLWWKSFGRIRNYLLSNMEWMLSDATGIPPRYARPAGFEQVTYGRWRRHIRSVGNPGKGLVAEFRKLWKRQRYRPLSFRFGYPDGSRGSNHLLITRRRTRGSAR